MKLRINEKDTSMKYKTYGNIEKCFNILVNEKGYSKEDAQDIIDHMLADYKYNPNSNDSLLRRVNLVLSKDEYEKEYGITERYTRLKEKETPNIEVKHEGILEVPEGKNVDDLPLSHFVNLANKKGLSKITKALNNLQVWNKNDDPKLSKWAGDMIDKLNKKLKKDEGVTHRAYNLDNDESRRKEIADRLGGKFTPDDHLLMCKDNKLINIQIGKKYKCTAFNGQRVEVVSVDDIFTNDGQDTATLTVSYRHKLYGVASTQLYESVDSIDKLNKKFKKDESLIKERNFSYSRTVANGDLYTCPICGNEIFYDELLGFYCDECGEQFEDETIEELQIEEKLKKDESLGVKESNNSIRESNNLYDYIDDMGFSHWGHMFGYKIYNEMTDDNTFVLSDNERTAKEYGEWLVDIYKNYDEETIEDRLNEFDYIVSRSKSDVIVTDPEYWKDERKNDKVYIVYEYDNSDVAYIVQIIGSWSSRF